MIKNRVFTYKRIIVLTIQRLKELETLLLKHCDSIKYKAITVLAILGMTRLKA